MIHLFRKIRKELIKGNRTTQYLRYAIGEIILVMIGILLALQVNNWNENRKDKIIEQEYLNRLQLDIGKDHATLLFSKELADERIHQVEILSNAVQHPDSLFTNTSEIIESIEKVTWLSYLPLSKIVFNELQTSGNMTLIESKALREKLATYYAEANHWEMILNGQQYQKEFGIETAGILNNEMLAQIENSEPLYLEHAKEKLELGLSRQAFAHMIRGLASNTEATNCLPQIYHYHILSKKVIELLISKNEELLATINDNLHSN